MSTPMSETLFDFHFPSERTVEDARNLYKNFLAEVDAGEVGNGTGVFDHTRNRAESFFIAGNGPSAWVWFVYRDGETDIAHAYVQFSDGGALAYIDIPAHHQQRLLNALRQDVKNGINR